MDDRCAIAWAAGLIEGEGCFTVYRSQNGKRVYLAIKVTSTDRDVLERVYTILGFPKPPRESKRKRRPGRDGKRTYELQTSGIKAIEIAEQIRPWLGTRRTKRLDEILALIADNPPLERPRRLLTAAEAQQARRMRADGKTQEEIARHLGAGTRAVRLAVPDPRGSRTPPCGHTVPNSHAGYKRHRRRGEMPCVPCRTAHADATRGERLLVAA